MLPFGRTRDALPTPAPGARIPPELLGFSLAPRLSRPGTWPRGMQAWDYWVAFTDDVLVCTYVSVARSNLRLASRLGPLVIAEEFAYRVDREHRRLLFLGDVTNGLKKPAFGDKPLHLGALPGESTHAAWGPGTYRRYTLQPDASIDVHARLDGPGLDLRFDVDASKPLAAHLAVDFGDDRFQLNSKGIGLVARSGRLKLGDAHFPLDGARVAWDFGRGSWPVHAAWLWLHAADRQGRALNLGSRWHPCAAHENAVSSGNSLRRVTSEVVVRTVDGRELGPGDVFGAPARVEVGGSTLTFQPAGGAGARVLPPNRLARAGMRLPFVPGLRGVQWFGWFSGDLDGVRFDDAFGWIESVRARF